MRIGIFSDIHGNNYAFEKVYRSLLNEGCDMYLFLGDICGYYYHQNEVIDMMCQLPNLVALAGNHDRMFLEAIGEKKVMENYTSQFGLSYSLLMNRIDDKKLDYLIHLRGSYVSEEGDFAAFHGSPWSPYHEYVYPDSPIDHFVQLPYKYIFLGHTHHPMDRKINGIRLINPGSVGQPRNGGLPTFGIFDTQTEKLELKEVSYNTDLLKEEIREAEGMNNYLITVLERGTE